MPTLSQLLTDRAEADIAIGAGTLHVVYRPGAISPALAHRMADISQVTQSTTEQQVLDRLDALVDVLLTLLVSWDLEAEDAAGTATGEPMPINQATLAGLGLGILGALYSGLLSESQPDPTKAGASLSPSPAITARGNAGSSSTRASKRSLKS